MPERDWLYEMLEGLRRDQREQSAALRVEMSHGFEQLRDEMQIQNGRVRKSEERLTIIETERAGEERLAVKRGAAIALLASAGLTGLVELAKGLFRR